MSDVREWLAVHCPDVQPWQVDCVEAFVAPHQEGRPLTINPPSSYSSSATARLEHPPAEAWLAVLGYRLDDPATVADSSPSA